VTVCKYVIFIKDIIYKDINILERVQKGNQNDKCFFSNLSMKQEI